MSAPVAVKVVLAPSSVISVSAIDTAVLLISKVDPESTAKVVPVAIDRVPEVKLSDVSLLRNWSEFKLSNKSASKPLPDPSFPLVQTVPLTPEKV